MAASIWKGAAAAAAVAVAACAGDELTITLPITAITVSPGAITAIPGDTVRLRVTDDRGRTVRPSYFTVFGDGVRVDTAGLPTAVAPGVGVVTVVVGAGGQMVASSVPVTVLGLTLTPRQATLALGASVQLAAEFSGDPAWLGALTWTSGDTTVATVDATSRVRGVGQGIARIAASARGGRLRAEAPVTVLRTGPIVQSLNVTPTQVTLQTGATQQLEAVVVIAPGSPAGTSREALFTSSDTAVATVSETGLVTARRGGTAIVTVAAAAAPTLTQAVAVTVR